MSNGNFARSDYHIMSEKVAKLHLEEKLRDHSLKRTKYRLDCLVCNTFEKDGKTHSLCENREKKM